MIVVRIMGGLGNQMFQYAAGRALAEMQDTELKLDLTWFDTQQKRRFELDLFKIRASFASEREIACFEPPMGMSITDRWIDGFKRAFTRSRYPIIKEQALFSFDPKILETKGHALLIGSWQHEEYFLNIRSQILREFQPAAPLTGIDAETAERIESSPGVAVHVRRGDYVSDEKTRRFHGTCSPDYYSRALDRISERVGNLHVFVFTDDRKWVKENIRTPYPTEYVTHETGAGSHVGIHLMRLCRHHVIANSTYGWWGAWLNEHPHQIVVAPKTWLAAGEADGRDPVPEPWLRE